MTNTQPRFSIIIPAYNEAANLPRLLARYREIWEDLPAELIVVDNGSGDTSASVLAEQLARPDMAFARSLRIEHNRGYGHGIHSGLEAASGEILGFSHADMQTDPADLFRGYHRLLACDDPRRSLVKGERQPRPFRDELVTRGMSVVASTVLLTRLTDINAQPKIFHRSHLDRLTAPPDGIPYDLYVVYRARRAGLRVVTIPVVFAARAHGESRWAASFLSRHRTILDMLRVIVRLRFQRP